VDAASLAKKRCVPCDGDTPRLSADEIRALRIHLPDWRVVDDRRLTRTFRFPDFGGPMAFANRIAAVAEEEGHHPDLHVHWGRLEVEITTHAIRGLSENDFVLAAKIDRL
jgi:4a-hydroxytetrahydrobiopterin dehydratase